MSAKAIDLGAEAWCRLVDSIPDLGRLAFDLLHIQELSEQLGKNNPDVLLSRTEFQQIGDEYEHAVDDYLSTSGFLSKGNNSTFLVSAYNKMWESIARRSIRLKIEGLRVRCKYIAESLEACVAKKELTELFIGREGILDQLGTMDVEIVCILGVAGIGKTTLAKLFYQADYGFQRFGWVNLSIERWDLKSLLQDLMLQLDRESLDVRTMSEIDLMRGLHKLQIESRCLIVLDGVWSEAAWSNLVKLFPSKQQGTISKVLVTTQIHGVGDMICDGNSEVRFVLEDFSEDESWMLIAEKVVHSGININAYKELIKKIARKCNHVPLAINLLGEYLARKHTRVYWSALHRHWEGDQGRDGMQHLLALIFMDLPVNLKHCLLYMVAFFENLEIDTQKLYTLWIAEGLVQSVHGGRTDSMIQIADCYLQDLASRGLVEVVKEDYLRSRKFRSCRLSSAIRNFSLVTAKEENYLTVIDNRLSTSGSYEHFSSRKAGKVAVHLGENHCGCSISSGQKRTDKIHSLLLQGTSTFQSPHNIFQEESLCMLMGKDLKVLHLDDLNFGAGKYPKQIEKLVFLTYLSFKSCYLKELPSSIRKLSKLQTLDLRVREGCVITIHNVLRKLGRMKHLFLPQLFCLHNYEKLELDTLRELETLENFDSKLCSAEDLIQLVNLRFLTASIYDNLEDLEDTAKSSKYLCEASLQIKQFHCFPQCEIEKLFQCNGLNKLYLGGHLGTLPIITCSSLTVMMFNGSKLYDDPMPMLGKLPNLRVLVFDNYAFTGKQLCSTLGFYELRYLRLSTLPNCERLIIKKGTMSKLYGLTILGCKNLKFPIHRFNFLRKLKLINVKGTTEAFQELQDLLDGNQLDVFSKYSMY